ncbi:MAG: DUF4164 family protein [Clostridiales bacterium]|jgi:outer membrane cobalamin receptor|nr:DUF4164 family protein [Clostridiales bacterium]
MEHEMLTQILTMLNGINARLDSSEAKVEARLDSFEAKIEARLDSFEARLDSFEAKIEARLDGFEAKIEARLDGFEAKIEARLDKIEAQQAEDSRRIQVIFEHSINITERVTGHDLTFDALQSALETREKAGAAF